MMPASGDSLSGMVRSTIALAALFLCAAASCSSPDKKPACGTRDAGVIEVGLEAAARLSARRGERARHRQAVHDVRQRVRQPAALHLRSAISASS